MTQPRGTSLEEQGFSLEIPEGIAVQTSIAAWSEAQLRDRGVQPPPGLAGHPELYVPLGPPDERGVAHVIELRLSEADRARVSADAPLRLRLPPDAQRGAADLLPIAYDGQDHLPVGCPSHYEWVGEPLAAVPLDLTWLPRQAPAGGDVDVRLLHALRLFIYKKLGQEHLIPHLRRVSGINQQKVQYSKIRKKDFHKGDKVAVFVHGFGSDTQGAILQCARFGPKKVRLFGQVSGTKCLTYDHLLAFDYEGFGTSVLDNGRQLLSDLRKRCGFHRQDGITVDLFTHSMGSIVSRCTIELLGGDRLIDQLVESGAPNAGTPLVELSSGVIFLLTVLINLWAPAPPLGALGTWLVKRFFEQGVGLKDLEPDSKLVKRLRRLKCRKVDARYLTLAGENQVPEEQGLLERLWRKVMLGIDMGLDAFYGGQNDGVIPVKSMRRLRKRDYAALKKANLPCHHFGYFQADPDRPDGPTEIGAWMCR